MPENLMLWGTALAPVILGLVMLLQQLGLKDYWADWLRSALFGLATLAVLYQADIALIVPWVPDVANKVAIALGVFLTMRGVWPDMRSGWNKAVHKDSDIQAKAGMLRNRFR
jgi:hypothetical protein